MSLKVGIIGLGRMGERHLLATRNLGFNIIGLCDTDTNKIDNICKKYDLPQSVFFETSRDLVKQAPDLLIIATTAPSHYQLSLEGMQNGIPYLLCEKPLASSLAQGLHMVEAAQKYNCKLAVNHQTRYLEQFLTPQRICNSDDFGGLIHIAIHTGNSGLAMLGTHYFELFRLMANENISEVTAWLDQEQVANPRGPQFEDKGGHVFARTSSGKTMHLALPTLAGHGILIHYVCRSGQLTVDSVSGNIYKTSRLPEHRGKPTTQYACPSEINFDTVSSTDAVKSTEQLLTALIEGQEFPTAENALQALMCVVASHVSHEKNHVAVSINPSHLPIDRVFSWA